MERGSRDTYLGSGVASARDAGRGVAPAEAAPSHLRRKTAQYKHLLRTPDQSPKGTALTSQSCGTVTRVLVADKFVLSKGHRSPKKVLALPSTGGHFSAGSSMQRRIVACPQRGESAQRRSRPMMTVGGCACLDFRAVCSSATYVPHGGRSHGPGTPCTCPRLGMLVEYKRKWGEPTQKGVCISNPSD